MIDNYLVLSLGTGLFIIISIYGATAILLGGSRTCALGAIATAVLFGVTPWIALWNLDDGNLPIGGFAAVLVYVGVALFCASVLIVGHYLGRLPAGEVSRPGQSLFSVAIRKAANVDTIPVLGVFLMNLVIRVVLYLQFSYIGGAIFESMLSVDNTIPYAVQTASQFLTLLDYGLFMWASIKVFSPKARWFDRALTLAIFVQSAPFIFLEGRRIIFEHMLLLQFGYGVSHRFRFDKKVIVGIVLFLPLFHFVLSPVFLIFRGEFSSRYQRTRNFSEALSLAVMSFADDPDLFRTTQATNKDNLSERPLIMRFNAKICDSQLTGTPVLYGAAMWNSALMAIPRFLLGSKDDIAYSEILICRHFGLEDPEVDTSSNLPAYGMADFGLFGCVLYGIFWGVTLSSMERLAWFTAARHPFFALAVLGMALHIALSIEVDPTTIWCALRNLSALLVLIELPRIWGNHRRPPHALPDRAVASFDTRL